MKVEFQDIARVIHRAMSEDLYYRKGRPEVWDDLEEVEKQESLVLIQGGMRMSDPRELHQMEATAYLGAGFNYGEKFDVEESTTPILKSWDKLDSQIRLCYFIQWGIMRAIVGYANKEIEHSEEFKTAMETFNNIAKD